MARKLGVFSDLYSRVNNLLDRRIDGVGIKPLNKTFPDATKESTFNLNYNHKTSAGQKFKFSTTSMRDVSKVGKSAIKTTGKIAAEPIFIDKDYGIESSFAVAKKDDRDTIELVEKYTKIENIVIAATFKVDNHQSVGAKVTYETDALSASVDVSRAFNWYLFSAFQTKAPADMFGQTDISVEGLAALNDDKTWLLGGAGNFQVKGSKDKEGVQFAVKNFTLAGSYKPADYQITGFARVNWEKNKDVAAGLNVFWEIEKDISFAGEAVVRPRATSTDDLFDYSVAAVVPFAEGKFTGRFGLDGFLGTNYTQTLSKGATFSIGASFDTLDLSNSAYSLTLTLDA